MTIDTISGPFSFDPKSPNSMDHFRDFQAANVAAAKTSLSDLAPPHVVTAALCGSAGERQQLRREAAPFVNVIDEGTFIVALVNEAMHTANAEENTRQIVIRVKASCSGTTALRAA